MLPSKDDCMKKPITIFILFLGFAIMAQTKAEYKWDLETCFQYATAHNIQINTLKFGRDSADQDLLLANAAKFPSLSAFVGNTLNNGKTDGSSATGPWVSQFSSTGSYLLNSSVVLWNGNYLNNNIKQKKLQVESADLALSQSQNNVALAITQSFLSILLAKENLTYVSDLVATSTELVRQGQQLYDAGSIAKNNLLQLQAQLAGDQLLEVQARNAISQDILALKQLLQLPSETAFDIIGPENVDVVSILPPLDEVTQLAVKDFPDAKIGQLGLKIAELDIRKAKAGFLPALSANAAIGSGYVDILANSAYHNLGYFNQASDRFNQSLGLALAVPIFSNRTNKTTFEKAKIALKVAALNAQNDRLLLTQAVQQAYLSAGNALQEYLAAQVQLKAVTETYRVGTAEFKLGGITSFDLLQQRNQYVQAVQSFTQAKYSALLQEKIYRFYAGMKITL